MVAVRDARDDDAAAIAALLAQLGYPAGEDAVRERLRALRATGCDRVLVAEQDGAVVGVADLQLARSIHHDGEMARLSAIVVDEAVRGAGVGRTLVAAVEDAARARGCATIFLTTAAHRAEAHAFYRRLGYEDTGPRMSRRLV